MGSFLAAIFGAIAVLALLVAYYYRKSADELEIELDEVVDAVQSHYLLKNGPLHIRGIEPDVVDEELWGVVGVPRKE